MGIMTPTALQQLATDSHCGRGHSLAEHGRRDPKSDRLICTLCQRLRLEERGMSTSSFIMPTEILVGLDIEADRLGISRSKLLSVIAHGWLQNQWEDRR